MSRFFLANRQKTRSIDLPYLRKLARYLAETLLGQTGYRLALHLVGADEMTRLNENFLHHAGCTDVITFNYTTPAPTGLEGEIFVCVDEAILQSRRFRRPWTEETIRYFAHGLLHLLGHDDRTPAQRLAMRRRENTLLRGLAKPFPHALIEKQAVSL
jgi:probable rRNA maturation factor